jgi:hypothetical protein
MLLSTSFKYFIKLLYIIEYDSALKYNKIYSVKARYIVAPAAIFHWLRLRPVPDWFIPGIIAGLARGDEKEGD